MTRENAQRLISPHYPQTDMIDKDAIHRGMEWTFGNMEKLGFTIRNLWIDGDKAAVELDTHHVFKGGMGLKSPQEFIFETPNGLITRLQSYMPYRPRERGGNELASSGQDAVK